MTIVACQTKIWRSKKVPFLGLRTLKTNAKMSGLLAVKIDITLVNLSHSKV